MRRFAQIVVFYAATATGLAVANPWLRRLESLAKSRDYLSVRSEIKFNIAKQKLSAEEMKELRTFIYSTPEIGLDLSYQWDGVERMLTKGSASIFDRSLQVADMKSLKKDFRGAAQDYARIARQTKADLIALQNSGKSQAWGQARLFYSYVLHDLARALYGAGDYAGSLKVYEWIDISYPRFRTVLLEKMWAAIRSRNSPYAIGAWYSMRSPFFSEFMAPEEFLVALDALQTLCLTEEARKLYEEMKSINWGKSPTEAQFRRWVKKDYETLVLFNLASQKPSGELKDKANADRLNVYKELRRNFSKEYGDIVRSYGRLKAMGFVAQLPESQTQLQSLAPLEVRDSYFKRGLEVWPRTRGEYWLDEIGSHVYLGESQCR